MTSAFDFLQVSILMLHSETKPRWNVAACQRISKPCMRQTRDCCENAGFWIGFAAPAQRENFTMYHRPKLKSSLHLGEFLQNLGNHTFIWPHIGRRWKYDRIRTRSPWHRNLPASGTTSGSTGWTCKLHSRNSLAMLIQSHIHHTDIPCERHTDSHTPTLTTNRAGIHMRGRTYDRYTPMRKQVSRRALGITLLEW